jgi:hypothetical protein
MTEQERQLADLVRQREAMKVKHRAELEPVSAEIARLQKLARWRAWHKRQTEKTV